MNNIILNALLDPKKLMIFFLKYLISIIAILGFMFGVLTFVFHKAWQSYEQTITTDYTYRDVSLTTLCTILQCSGILIHGETPEQNRFFSRNGDEFESIPDENMAYHEQVFFNLTKKGELMLRGTGYDMFIDSEFIFHMVYNTFMVLLYFTLIPYTIWSLYKYGSTRKKEILANRKMKDNMELSLQRNITEMIHHELNAPLALILAQVDDLYYKTFKFNHNRHGYVEEPVDEKDHDKIELFEDIYFSIERINTVLTTLARTKHIKFNNGTVPLKLIIKNMESSINAFKLEKIKVVVTDDSKELLNTHSVISSIGNGAMMNILHILFTNAVEAYSTEIQISAEMVPGTRNRLYMYVTDNGCGIKNEKGEYEVNQKLFTNGYSSKSKFTDFKETILSKLFKIKPEMSERGIGLYLVKNLLKTHRGDICVHSTSENGTTFKLTIPVKDTEGK